MGNRIELDEIYPLRPYDPDFIYVPKPWLVEGLWLGETINAVFGLEKAGKSRVACWLLVAALLRQDVFGLKTTYPGRVLYLAGEEPYGHVVARVRRYASLMGGTLDPHALTVIEAAGMHLEQGFYRDWLHNHLVGEEYKVLFVDPYRRVHSAQENDNTQMAGLHNEFRRWSNHDNITSIIEHHSRHYTDADERESAMEHLGGWGRGAKDLAAIVNSGNYVDRSNFAVQILRKGSYPDLPPLKIVDNGGPDHNPENDLGFQLPPLEKIRR